MFTHLRGPILAAVLLLSLSLSGCATCQQHPVWCAVGTAVVVGSIAASVEHQHDQRRAPATICRNGTIGVPFNPACGR
jgi:hypothetical protein